MTEDKIEIHTDPLNHHLMDKLDQMRPKADPMPLAKSRALVIGVGSAGIALIILACALTFSYIQGSKRAAATQLAQIEANNKKAAVDADIAKIMAGAEAAPASTITQIVPQFLKNSEGGDKTDIRTTITIFKSQSFAGGAVMTGWDFRNSAAKKPNSQFCYFSRSAGIATSDRLNLGIDGKHLKYSRQDRLKIKLTESQVLQARRMCQWFDDKTVINSSDDPKRTSALANCLINKIARQHDHLGKPMGFCNGGKGRMVAFGEIVKGTYTKFKQAIKASQPKTIMLDSPGGLTDEAYQMATLIRSNQINTHALSQCNSACVTVMSGGVFRTANNNATFGLHRPGWEYPKQITRAEIHQYRAKHRKLYIAHGVSPELETVEWSIPNSHIKNISVSNARSFNLVNS